MDNPFSWDSLTSVPTTDEVFNPFGIVFLIVFSLGFLVSIFLYNDGARRHIGHSVKRRMLRRGAGIAMTVFGIGLFFFGIRVLQINPFGFGLRIWLWLSVLAAILMIVYFVYYWRTVYPSELQAYEERRLKQQYLRPTAGGRARRRAAAGARSVTAPLAGRDASRRSPR